MKIKTFTCMGAPLLLAAALTACGPSADPMGDTSQSIREVATAVATPEMREVIADSERELVDAATEFGTTPLFERDILVCEQLHQTAVSADDPAYDADPESGPLSDCINGTIASHDMMEN